MDGHDGVRSIATSHFSEKPFIKNMVSLLNYAQQLCPNSLKAIYRASAASSHLRSSLKDINTPGNKTQSDGL